MAATPLQTLHGRNTAEPRDSNPKTPTQANLGTSKRQHRDHQQVPSIASPNIGGSAYNVINVSDAVAKHNKTILDAISLRAKMSSQIAQAIDQCITSCSSQAEREIAQELQQLVIVALTTSSSNASTRTSSSTQSAPLNIAHQKSTHASTWALVASLPQTTGAGQQSKRIDIQTAAMQRPKAHTRTVLTKEDLRIFIAVPAATRLQKPSPFAVRQAICGKVPGLTLENIPSASAIKTGWAITPASKTIRDELLSQEKQALMMQAVDGMSVRTPEQWLNYAVQNVPSSYRTYAGIEVPITRQLVEEEVYSQAGKTPVDCRTSRLGPDAQGRITWIISYRQPVRAFRLFGISDYSKEIRKQPAILRHEEGCQGYCNPRRCTRASRCIQCGERQDKHDSVPFGDKCTNDEKCANCYGPHRAGDHGCPAKPRRISGKIVKSTKQELAAIRRIGLQATQSLRTEKQRQAERTASAESEATTTGPAHSSPPTISQTTANPPRKRRQSCIVQVVIPAQTTKQKTQNKNASVESSQEDEDTDMSGNELTVC